jgi:hypothetical protein
MVAVATGVVGLVVLVLADIRNALLLGAASCAVVCAGVVGLCRRGRLWYAVVVSTEGIAWGKPGKMVHIPFRSIRDVRYTDYGEVHQITVRTCDGGEFRLYRIRHDQMCRVFGVLSSLPEFRSSPERKQVLAGPCGTAGDLAV